MRLLALCLAIACVAAAPRGIEGPRRALVNFEGVDISGKVMLEQASINSPVKIRGVIYGLEPGRHGLHIHTGKSLGERCESVGAQFQESSSSERSVGYLGNVKTFSGSPSRTDVNLISSLVSLYNESPVNVLERSVVIHAQPDDWARVRKISNPKSALSVEDRFIACGLIRSSELEESILLSLEKPYKVDKIEQSILDGEKTWENVRHPHFGAQDEESDKISSLETSEKREKDIDLLTRENAAPTRKMWMAGYTYEYDYQGWTTTGIMAVSTKVAGGSIKGRLVIEPVDENTLTVALLNTKAKQFNEDVMGKYSEVDPGQEVRIIDQEHLEKPMTVKMVSGKVESVSIGKEEPLWIVNFKRALVSQLQLQLDETSGVFQRDEYNNYYAENTVYHTMEGASTGECDTWYHLSPLPTMAIESLPELLPVPELCENFPVYEIVKNKNLDSCRILPNFLYNSNHGLKCDPLNGAGCENKYAHTDITRITGCTHTDGHFIVQRIQSTDKFAITPFSYETESTEAVTIQYFWLRSAIPTGYSKLASRVPTEVHVYQTLAYSYDEAYKTHGPLMGKPTLREANSPMIMEVEPEILKKEAQRLWSEIVADLESEEYYYDPSVKHVNDKINMLRRVFSSMDYSELMAFVDKVWETKEWSTSNQIVVDTLMLSGTNPALMIVREWILQGKISGEWAAQVISALVPTIETPTKELLNSFFEFLKSDVVASQRQLKITTALSLSRLVYQACVNTTYSLQMFPRLVMGEFCTPSDSIVSQQLVPWLVEQIKNASDAGERIAFITALGNIGHEMIVPYLKPFIASCEPASTQENEWYERNQRDLANLSKKEMRKKWIEAKKKQQEKEEKDNVLFSRSDLSEDWEDEALCNIVRTKAIFALTNLAIEAKDIVGHILMPIYFNKAEETEVRLAALTLLFVYDPPQAFWNRVAVSTWWEPNAQVAHFIYTHIASRVLNKDSMDRIETTYAESVMPFVKPFYWTSYASMNLLKASYAEKSRIGYLTEITAFPGYETFFPSHLYQSAYVNMGPWFTKIAEWAIDSKHPEKFLDGLLGKPGLRFKAGKEESTITSPELQKIRDDLKIHARATGQPELFIYWNFLDNYQRFYTVNPKTIWSTLQKTVLKKGLQQSGNSNIKLNYHKYLSVLDSLTRIPSSMGLAYTWVSHHSTFINIKTDFQTTWAWSALTAKIEGTFKPVLTNKFSTRMMVETPFTRSYPTTGLDMEFAFTNPGKFAVEGDLKTAKFQTSWEMLGDKLRLAKYSVIPFTTIRKVNDFTPATLLAETKHISLMEEPEEHKYTFGEKLLGMNFVAVARADAKAAWQPLAFKEDLIGTLSFWAMPTTLRQREWSLYFDAAKSETKGIKTYWAWSIKTDSKVESPASHLHSKALFDTTFGQKIKSGQWVHEQHQDWINQKFQHVFQSLTNPTGYTLDFTTEFIGKTSRRFGSSIAYAMDADSHRASIMMEKRTESETGANFVFCAEYDGQFPENMVFQRKEMIKESDIDRSSVLKFSFGKTCTDDRKVTVSTKWTRSEEDITPTLRAKWQETECRKQEMYGRPMSEECVAARRLASFFNKAVVTVDYNEMPAWLISTTNKASNFVRHWWWSNMYENTINVNNKEGQIRFEALYSPLEGSVDLKVFKPHGNTFFHNLEITPAAEVILPRRMAYPRPVLAAPGVCMVGSETVTTFDEFTFNATFSGCDQLLMKDCSDRYQMAVLSREEADKKIVTVLLNKEKIEVFPAQQIVKINGMDISVSSQSYVLKNSENEIVAVVKKTVDNYIEVNSPRTHMIRILVDSKEVVVLSSPIHRGRLCGLCGSMIGNKLTDMTGPRECAIPRDLMDAAYELKNSPAGCKSEIPTKDVTELRRVQEECLKERSETVWGISDVTPLLPKFQQNVWSTQAERHFPSQWTVYRNKMIVQDGKRCFSTEAVPKCVEGSQPSGTEEKKLGFHCVPKNQLSEKLNEEMPRRPLDELMGKEIDVTRVYTLPTTCIPF